MNEINPERVEVSLTDHVAHVRLVREDKMNAVDQEMISSIIAAGDWVAGSAARACVVSGAGKAFCAGIDTSALGAMAGQDPAAMLEPRTHGAGTTNQWQEVAMVWTRVPVPVIAALHGPVFGAGCQLALGADIRIGGRDVQMAVMEMKWGIVPDMGGMVLLPRLVREDVLRWLTYTASPIDADQALQWGLLTQVVYDPLGCAMALAQDLTRKSPSGLRAAKALITEAVRSARSEEILLAESRVQADLIGKPHQVEVIAAQLQKREPNFK